jgi:hypothetical protein
VALAGANVGAAIMIGAGATSETTSCATLQRAGCRDVIPVAQTPVGANNYFAVYVGRWRDYPLSVTGIDFGIQYTTAIVVTAWNMCGDLEVPTANWPGNNSGDSVVWVNVQSPGPVLVGWFKITSYTGYGPMIMQLGSHPAFDECRVLDGSSNLDSVAYPALGSLDGTPGNNPCEAAVKPSTWGSIKSQFRE